jgi:hypothetical protein
MHDRGTLLVALADLRHRDSSAGEGLKSWV